MPACNWSVPTSPRSPHKIKPELKLLQQHFEGKKWDKQSQRKFSEILAKADAFKGEIPQWNDWAGRARFGTMKFWGFVYKNSKGNIVITRAGKDLLQGKKKEEDVFLHQMLKWQYPDNQHNGKEFPSRLFKIHPFFQTIKLIHACDGLTKHEIAIFLFTTTKEDQIAEVVQEILAFRQEYKAASSKVNKHKVIDKWLRNKITKAFTKEIRKEIGKGVQVSLFGNDNIERLSRNKKKKLEKLIQKHKRTFYDYADALIRYFTYTNLLSMQGNKLKIAKMAEFKIKSLITMSPKIFPYKNTDRFYAYYGEQYLVLPYENKIALWTEIKKIHSKLLDLEDKLRQRSISIEESVGELQYHDDVEKLKEIEDELRDRVKVYHIELLAVEFRTKEKLLEINNYYEDILNRSVIEPATYFEWNNWRAFEALDVAKTIKPYLKMDEDLQPMSHAGGNVPDLEIHYNDFIIVCETTLKTGATQWRDESEPVPVHVRKIQDENKKKVFGLFIAPRIDKRTCNVFYACGNSADWCGAKVDVIPIKLEQFRKILDVYLDKSYDPSNFKQLLLNCLALRNRVSGKNDPGVHWNNMLETTIESWISEQAAS